MSLWLVLLLASVNVWDPSTFGDHLAMANQEKYIQNGSILVGPRAYSVHGTYTIKERQRIYQECQKSLVYGDQVALLYAYQYVVKPYPFPYLQWPLANSPPVLQ